MKLPIIVVSVVSLLLAGGLFAFFTRNQVPTHVRQAFVKWSKDNQRAYGPSEIEHRTNIFYMNYLKVQESNKANTYVSALNKFADLTSEEFKVKFTGLRVPAKTAYQQVSKGIKKSATAVPASVDWVAKGAVTPIKNQ
jgi:KDEL-tailed cysteine endopeptidase